MADFKIDPDYVEVSVRLRDLFAKYPKASMRGTYELVVADGATYVVYRAECWRTPDDPAPGVGTAWEPVPGKTPYTRGSEIQNAETSAWGRAIVAVGASESKRIASADEMRSARARQDAPAETRPDPEWVARVESLKASVLELDLTGWVKDQSFGWPWPPEACDLIAGKVATEREKQSTVKGEPPVMSRAESKANEAAKEASGPDPADYSEDPFYPTE